MIRLKLSIFLWAVLFLLNQTSLVADEKNYKIIKLVNDQVITNYDLEQRIKLYAILNNINLNNENIEKLAKNILLIMVDEKLQIEKISEYKISIQDSEINDYLKKAYLIPGMEISDLVSRLDNNNIDIKILKEIIRIRIGWNNLSGRLFYRTSEINKNELIKTIQNDPSLSEDQAENILLQKQISLRAKKLLRDIKSEANIETR